MSGLDLYTPQESIKDFLVTEFPGHEIVEDAKLDDENTFRNAGNLVPYITIRYGVMRPVIRGRAIAGARYDEYYSTVDVGVVAPTGSISRDHMNVIRDRLIGFKPDGAERLRPGLTGNDQGFYIFSKAKPTGYFVSERFEFNLNGEDVGAYIPKP